MTYAPTTHKLAMAIGAAGAMVEVTGDVLLNEGGVSRRWGRQSTFSDTSPGQFAFTLDNRDGKYTPDNVNSTLATKVTEGMRVAWELNGTLRSGKISATQLIFPAEGKADAARLRVTVSDVLADAARTAWDSMVNGMVNASGALAFWPLSEDAAATIAADQSGLNRPGMTAMRPDVPGANVAFGAPGAPGTAQTAASFVVPANTGGISYDVGLSSAALVVQYPVLGDYGYWGFWAAPSGNSRFTLIFSTFVIEVVLFLDGGVDLSGGGVSNQYIDPPTTGFHYYTVRLTATQSATQDYVAKLYIDGVLKVTTPFSLPGSLPSTQQVTVFVQVQNVPGDPPRSASFARILHSLRPANEYLATSSDIAVRLTAVASTVSGLVLDALPSDLSPAIIGEQSGTSALDAINELMRGEQGHVWSATSGTLLAPVEKVKVRARSRPEAVTASFSTNADVHGAPDLQRNTTNMVSAVTVTGPNGKVTVYDRVLEARVGSANTSVSVAMSSSTDLEAFGQDRILRGINKGIDVVSFDIDPGGTTANRWAELMALTPGLRYRVSDLPVAQLGVSTWDGWFLGASESHDGERSMFTLYFEPVLGRTAIADTDRAMASGELTLTAGINSSVTSMSVATTGSKLATTDLPYTLLLDAEQVTVTACTGATPQVATIVRGVNGTTAAAHTTTAVIESVPDALAAY